MVRNALDKGYPVVGGTHLTFGVVTFVLRFRRSVVDVITCYRAQQNALPELAASNTEVRSHG